MSEAVKLTDASRDVNLQDTTYAVSLGHTQFDVDVQAQED